MAEGRLMRRAIAPAEETLRPNSGGPFGALILRRHHVVAEGHNRVIGANGPPARSAGALRR